MLVAALLLLIYPLPAGPSKVPGIPPWDWIALWDGILPLDWILSWEDIVPLDGILLCYEQPLAPLGCPAQTFVSHSGGSAFNIWIDEFLSDIFVS